MCVVLMICVCCKLSILGDDILIGFYELSFVVFIRGVDAVIRQTSVVFKTLNID